MLVVQTRLERKTEHGKVEQVCWLDVRPNVHVGSVISLEGSEERWRVVSQGHVQDASLIPRKWGLDLPKSQRLER